MLKAIQNFFRHQIQPAAEEKNREVSEHALQLATAALLIEVSRADFKVEAAERRTIEDLVQTAFGLSGEETAELVRLAAEEAEKSISHYDFTRLVDRNFSPEQKKHIVELLWRVAFSDAKVAADEEHLVRKVARLLHVDHTDFIDAKLRARDWKQQQ
ncbi:MAG: TerB family tellurite resistance protein [Acidobacteriota bacterium]